MNTIKFEKKNSKVIAHRGLSGIEFENTIAAFVAAGNRSYYGIETDVHVTKDGKFVVIHDDNTKRVGNIDIVIEESTYDELKKVKLGENDGELRRDLVIPDLLDYIRICKKYEKVAVLELKNRMETKHIYQIIDIIKNEKYLDKTIFISFNCDNLADIKTLLPKQEVQFLVKAWDKAYIEMLLKYNMGLDIYYKNLDKKLIDTLKEKKIKINCWTCDDKKSAEKLANMGIDYITTNLLE